MAKKGRWIKERKPISPYPKTSQQTKIREAGRRIAEECTGLKGREFYLCRSGILKEVFKKLNQRPATSQQPSSS